MRETTSPNQAVLGVAWVEPMADKAAANHAREGANAARSRGRETTRFCNMDLVLAPVIPSPAITGHRGKGYGMHVMRLQPDGEHIVQYTAECSGQSSDRWQKSARHQQANSLCCSFHFPFSGKTKSSTAASDTSPVT